VLSDPARDRGVRRLGLVSSALAPVLLIGGWTVAAQLQSAGFDSGRETISALAARGADHRWVMTVSLAGSGACHVLTAVALRPARKAGRVVLAASGVATLLAAASPLPVEGEDAPVHTAAATVAFAALATWPALAGGDSAGFGLRPTVARTVAVGLLGLVGWFAAELAAETGRLGLAERVAAGAQSVWPLVATVAAAMAVPGRAG